MRTDSTRCAVCAFFCSALACVELGLAQQRDAVDPGLYALTCQIEQLLRAVEVCDGDVVRREGVLEVAISLRDARQQREPRRFTVHLGGALLSERGFPRRALAAPQVEGVAGGQVGLLGRGVAGERLGKVVGERRAGEARLGVERWVARRIGRARLCGGEPDACFGGGHVRIRLQRLADQGVERGIAESAPPVAVRPGSRCDAGKAGVGCDRLFGAQLHLRRQAAHVRAAGEQKRGGESDQSHVI